MALDGPSAMSQSGSNVADAGVLFLARHWFEPRSELAFVTRSLAAATSRLLPVTVVAPGSAGERIPDGGFDVVGAGRDEPWQFPSLPPPAVVVDEVTPAVSNLLADPRPGHVWFLSSVGRPPPLWRRIAAAGGSDGATDVGMHVPVNRTAEQHRHHGFGFTGYQLVLPDGAERLAHEPPREVQELGTSFPEDDIVVVGSGRAQAWRGATLRGEIAVTTRMDLQRLLAHALFVVDLAPGPYLARECVEALRLGTPIVVPAPAPAAAEHARAAGGGVFDDLEELMTAASRMHQPAERARVSELGRRYADERYGRPEALVAHMGSLLAGTPTA